MNRKTVLGIIIVLLAGGGIFWRIWQNQADVRALNKTLPSGIRVTKSLFGNEYRVVNKIDGYSFKIPKAWQGVKSIIYAPEVIEKGYTTNKIEIEGKEGQGRVMSISRFSMVDVNNLEEWIKTIFDTLGFTVELSKGRIQSIDIVKAKEDQFLGTYIYFFQKNSAIYAISNPVERFLEEIIINGEW